MRSITTYCPTAWRQCFPPSPLINPIISYNKQHPFNHHHHHHHDGPQRRPFSDSARPLIYPEAINTEHHDLASYAAYAARTGLDVKSKTYVGTRYEYAVAASLATLGFDLKRVGGRSDCGIDLLGTWRVPASPAPAPPLRVLVQCKASASQSTRVGPHHVRELEGAFAGAPPGWRSGPGLLAFLVSPRPATAGVRDALAASRWPMGYFMYSQKTGLQQMLWNSRAEEEGLEGMGVSVGYSDDSAAEETAKRLVLTWKGKPYAAGPVLGKQVSTDP
ncbi:uncharacterized protein F4812DRAFT_417598 [Daldinia caldariorum]|uniref:uncharacterized protein n=1 Tax=Daldinia caldariorum TaxID=326644 RepID=UPI002008485C|nr:uncharacterized protein F4812DRAFT_417598 [Daldinia caldariorum]KAI1470442.1 hypothetical protein F4812DRAFT_417598 [Daldinia caldariorum]